MISHHNLFSLILLFVATTNIFANIDGSVLDSSSNEPIIGARVSISKTLLGDIVDYKGTFSIKTNLDTFLLEVNSPGYEKFTHVIKGEKHLNIKLNRVSYQSNEIIVSANKKTEFIQDVPISLSIITKNEFSLRNITSIDYALQYVPGVEVNQDNVSIRGSSGFSFGIGTRAIFLQDGIPLLSADNNDIKFDIIPILFVDRIEVIKGAGSALYGTSALGGVINVITSDPTSQLLVRSRIYSGVYDSPKYEQWKWNNTPLVNKGFDIGITKQFGSYGLMTSVSGFDKDSYRRYDGLGRISFFIKQLYNFDENSKIDLTANYSTSKSDDWVYWNSLDSALIPPTNTDESIKFLSNKFALSSQFKQILNNYSFFNIKLGLFHTFFTNQLDKNQSELRESNGNTYFIEGQYSNNLDENNSLITGIESRLNNVNSYSYGNNNQTLIGTYAQLENTNIKNLTATIGIRTDKELLDTIKTDIEYSPKLGLNYSISDDLKLRGSYGRGFRAASIAERFASVNFQGFEVTSNPHLKSEISQSIELGVRYDILNSENYLNLDLSGFYNKYDGLIEPTFETNAATMIKFKNIIEAEISGFELDLDYKYKTVINLKTSLTYLNPRNIIENKDLKYRSNVLWYSSLNYKLLPFEFQVDYRYKSKYNEIDNRLGITVKDYNLKIDAHILDISLSLYSDILGTKSKFTINLKNALNYYYLEMVGNMAPIRFLNFQIETEI